MHQDAHRLVIALKQLLRRDGISYAELARRIGVSEATLKRQFSRGGFTIERLARMCEAVGTDLVELARLVRSGREQSEELSLAQERALAGDPRLLLLFHLLFSGWKVPDIDAQFAFANGERMLLLARLDRLGLVELLPRERVRMRVPTRFSWRREGPIRRRYGAQALGEFLDAPFADERSLLRFEVRELGEASLQLLHRKLERLSREVGELADLDASLPAARKRSTGLVLAIRPWVFSLARALQIEP